MSPQTARFCAILSSEYIFYCIFYIENPQKLYSILLICGDLVEEGGDISGDFEA
jgi:hypothetical protein